MSMSSLTTCPRGSPIEEAQLATAAGELGVSAKGPLSRILWPPARG